MIFFVAIFVLDPPCSLRVDPGRGGRGVLKHPRGAVPRRAVRRVPLADRQDQKTSIGWFEYHGAEHKTIAAFEHGDPLDPEHVDRYSTVHVRCGTNFLIIVMVITIFVFTLFGTPGFWWRNVSRVIAIPVIAGVAY